MPSSSKSHCQTLNFLKFDLHILNPLPHIVIRSVCLLDQNQFQGLVCGESLGGCGKSVVLVVITGKAIFIVSPAPKKKRGKKEGKLKMCGNMIAGAGASA